jgi:hypothetical protein
MRRLFDTDAHTINGLADPIDLWYARRTFGDVDHTGDSVFLSESFLKMMSRTPSVQAINFVVDAAEDMRYFYNQARGHGKVDSSGPLAAINPKLGYDGGSTRIYHEYMQKIYDSFVSILTTKKSNNIITFDHFIKELLIYLNSITIHMPITKTNFIISKMNNPLNSGLMLELYELDHGEDNLKVDMFLNDKNYLYYRYTTERFGFLIDKNAPWRLVADIKSPAMKKYMSKYGLTYENLFKSYYYSSHKTDIENLKRYIFAFLIRNMVIYFG